MKWNRIWLIFALHIMATASLLEAQELGAQKAGVVDLKASDGTLLKATYFPAAKPGPGVLLFHQPNRTRKAWDDVAGQLAAAGIHTLTLDIRGFGESGGKPYGKLADKEIEQSRNLWAGDIDVAWQYLASRPGVNADLIGLGGAGFDGVDNAVQIARRHPGAVKSLALLSGETFLPGLRFLRQASHLPGLYVVADDDEYPPTADAMELLYITSTCPEKKFIHYMGEKAAWKWFEIYEGATVPATGSHGTDLFKIHPDLPATIVDWFVTTLIRTPGHAPAGGNSPKDLPFAPIINQLNEPGGITQVTQQLLEGRRKDPTLQLFPEAMVNVLGGDYLRVNETKPAVELMKLNALAYPESANAEDSLSDAYLADGQNELALAHARKALALLQSDTSDSQEWRDLILKGANRKITKLTGAQH